MDSLSENWMFEDHLDVEQKKYILLAYLQHVSSQFDVLKFFPHLDELQHQLKQLTDLKSEKNKLSNQFNGKLAQIDLRKLQLVYEKYQEKSDELNFLDEIIDFAIPNILHTHTSGSSIVDEIETGLEIHPIGILSSTDESGFLFLRIKDSAKTYALSYSFSPIEHPEKGKRLLKTNYIGKFNLSLAMTYEKLRKKLSIHQRNIFYSPAYAIESDFHIPIQEAFLPIARRQFSDYWHRQSA